MLDTGNTTQDFKALIQIFLAWVRRGPYARYRKSLEDKSHISTFNENRVSKALGTLGKVIPTENKLAHKALSTVSRLYQAERQYLIQRAETTEHLAGVGISVETASHDIMSAMNGTFALIDGLILAVGRKGTLDWGHRRPRSCHTAWHVVIHLNATTGCSASFQVNEAAQEESQGPG